ncbi:hypothetical protein Pcinc_018854 [Petrolisthes cinctipes]|uniref:Cadherin domain-containing protein n=1 Tax=Petrolisthes cinctipes TaxID=88211 RepID=A0AAE1FLB5_PETCI|nr:hypothetical protein Pcinc_018854 [Petrolisthes cinctipes]
MLVCTDGDEENTTQGSTRRTRINSVCVKDLITPTKSDYACAIIKVQDYNDRDPQFLANLYNDTVTETASIGTTVTEVFAVDRDKGANGHIMFLKKMYMLKVSEAVHVGDYLGVLEADDGIAVDHTEVFEGGHFRSTNGWMEWVYNFGTTLCTLMEWVYNFGTTLCTLHYLTLTNQVRSERDNTRERRTREQEEEENTQEKDL